MAPIRSYFDRLLDDDRHYFEAGAEQVRIPGASISRAPDVASVPAACCAHMTDDVPVAGIEDWFVSLEDGFSRLGSREPRVYVRSPGEPMVAVARARGYELSTESALMLTTPITAARRATDNLVITPVDTARNWDDKLGFHRDNDERPDGRRGDAVDWVAFERQKVRAGYMVAYLARSRGKVVATFALSSAEGLLRVKNLVVDWRHRNIGVATASLAWVQMLATSQAYPGVGLFSICGSAGDRLYRRRGFVEVGRISELFRPHRKLPQLADEPAHGEPAHRETRL